MINSPFTIYNSQFLRAALGVLMLLATPAPGWAQGAAPAPAPGTTVEFDPIRCWWRTSAGAVRVGESFSLVLTCAVLETDATRAVVDETKLGVSVAQFAPFEVVSGSHPADIRTPGRRFFQYDYVLRALGPDLIGQDVPLPVTEVTYRIESRLADNSAQQGRDLTYLLPPMKVKVASLVPADADDIRDTSTESFARVETLRSRAGLLRIVATGLTALGVVMTGLAIAGVVARARRGATRSERELGVHSMVSAATRELGQVARDAEGGWTEGLVSRAASAARIVAAGAIGRSIAQSRAPASSLSTEGRLLVKGLGGNRKPIAVSSAITSADVERAAHLAGVDPARRTELDALRSALADLTTAQYSAAPSLDRGTLDRAVSQVLESARRVQAATRWPNEAIARWRGRRAAQESHA